MLCVSVNVLFYYNIMKSSLSLSFCQMGSSQTSHSSKPDDDHSNWKVMDSTL